MRLFNFVGIFLFFVNICWGFTIEINLKNPSEIPLSCSVSLVRSYTDEYGNYWPFFGYLSKKGLLKQKPDAADLIDSGDESGWLKLPAHGRIVRCERISQKLAKWIVDVRVSSEKEIITRSFSIPEDQSVFYIYLYTVPISPGPIKLEILSADEVVDRNIEVISQTAKERKILPQKIVIYTDCNLRITDPPGLRKKHYNFLRTIGINGLMYNDFQLFPEVIENGFLYIRGRGASVRYSDYYKKPEEINDSLQKSALHISGVFERYNVTKYVRNLKLGDEISSGLLQDYIARGEQARSEVINYLKEKKIPLSDLNLSSYEKIELKPASIMKDENPSLYYWVNRVRMERINNLWKYAKLANRKHMPYSWSSPNWPAGGYLDGGYENQGWDLWHFYRNENLDGIWGEDWPGYERWLRGGNAFLVDMMRCQARNLPMGIYNVVEWNYSPVYARYKFYEQLSRGITEFFWYSYGCLRGNEKTPWEIKTDIVKEISLLNRDAGEAEKYLVNTSYELASIAILWTPAQEIWNPEYHNEIMALYYIVLHSNYNVDFISSYDVDSGELKKYKLLYMPFNYVEKATWDKIKKWVEDGGFLVIEGGFLKDECNNNIDLSLWIKGFSSKAIVRQDKIGRLPIELPVQKLIDLTQPIYFPVVCSKYNLSVPEKGVCLLRYKDGSPAAVQVSKGRGTIRVIGFYQGISYVWDQENRDKSKWGDVLLYHSFSPELRNFAVEPAADVKIKKVCDIDDNLVIARRRTGKNLECITIFDYGFGTKKPVLPVWDEIGEKTVKIEIKGARNVKCLHGSIKKENDIYTVSFKCVAMLLVDR